MATNDVCEAKDSERRFRLIEIAFKQALANQGNPELRNVWSQETPTNLAKNVVELVDTQLAAMETTPDTGPPAEEIERRARTIAGDLLTGLEKPILTSLRAEIQAHLDADLRADAANPRTNVRALAYREGGSDRSKEILKMIDAAMEKTGEAENGMTPYERDCHKHNLNLCTGEPNAK